MSRKPGSIVRGFQGPRRISAFERAGCRWRLCTAKAAKRQGRTGRENKGLAGRTLAGRTLVGRSGRARTCDPRFWRPVLYQLSYTPVGTETARSIRAVSSIGHAPFARAKRPNALFKPYVLRQTSPKPTRAHGKDNGRR